MIAFVGCVVICCNLDFKSSTEGDGAIQRSLASCDLVCKGDKNWWCGSHYRCFLGGIMKFSAVFGGGRIKLDAVFCMYIKYKLYVLHQWSRVCFTRKKSCIGWIWVFPKIGVPQDGWFIVENPVKMDDLGVPLFSETSIWEFHDQWKYFWKWLK